MFQTVERGSSATNARDTLALQYVLGPLAAQTISGTLAGQIRMSQAANNANFISQIILRVVSSDGSTVRGTLYAGDTRTTNVDELTTSSTTPQNVKIPAAGISPVSLASVAAQAGDYIVIELGVRANNTVTNNFNFFMRLGDAGATDLVTGGTETTDLNPWLEFSQTLTFQGSGGTPVELSGTMGAASTYAGAALEITDLLSGSVSGSSSWAGTLQTEDLLSGSLAGGAPCSGSLQVTDLISGRLEGASSFSGTAEVTRALAGRADGVGSLAGALETTRLLSGRMDGGAPWGGQLQVIAPVDLSGQMAGGASWSASALEVVKTLAGTLPGGQAWGDAPVEATDALAGQMAGASSFSGTLLVEKNLSGRLEGSSTYSGSLEVAKDLAGTMAGSSGYSGTAQVIRLLAGRVDGTSVWSGALGGIPLVLSGSLAGGAGYSGAVEVSKILAGEVALEGRAWVAAPETARLLAGIAASGEYHYLGSVEISRLLSAQMASSSQYTGGLQLIVVYVGATGRRLIVALPRPAPSAGAPRPARTTTAKPRR